LTPAVQHRKYPQEDVKNQRNLTIKSKSFKKIRKIKMSKPITMKEFKQAENAMSSIITVTSAIKKLDFGMLGQCPVKAKKFSDFTAFLSTLIDEAETVVNQAKAQHEARPRHLINAASMRASSIPQAIELEQKSAQGVAELHYKKTDELKKQGFGEKEIESILPYPQAELDEHEANVSNLKSEQKNLEQFLSDQLLCDINLLKGAKLEPFLQGQNQAG
jgi:hypothetical protein